MISLDVKILTPYQIWLERAKTAGATLVVTVVVLSAVAFTKHNDEKTALIISQAECSPEDGEIAIATRYNGKLECEKHVRVRWPNVASLPKSLPIQLDSPIKGATK